MHEHASKPCVPLVAQSSADRTELEVKPGAARMPEPTEREAGGGDPLLSQGQAAGRSSDGAVEEGVPPEPPKRGWCLCLSPKPPA